MPDSGNVSTIGCDVYITLDSRDTMGPNANTASMTGGIVSVVLGGFLIAPLIYRRESINWNSLFTYIFMFVGVFLFVVGLMAIIKARSNSPSKQETPPPKNIEPAIRNLYGNIGTIEQMPPTPGAASVRSSNWVKEERASEPEAIPTGSGYYKFAMVIGLLPLLPLSLLIIVNTTCSTFGTGLGFACKHPGYGHTFWLEIFAYYGTLGWLLSFPAWALLVFAGLLLKVR